MKAARSGLIVVAVAVVIASIPAPEGVTPQAWHLLAIFAATIAGLILRPLPMGAMVFLGVAALALLGIVPYRQALAGFANATVWLIVVAFLFARAFLLTGLGRRIAFLLIRSFGKRTLGLAALIRNRGADTWKFEEQVELFNLQGW